MCHLRDAAHQIVSATKALHSLPLLSDALPYLVLGVLVLPSPWYSLLSGSLLSCALFFLTMCSLVLSALQPISPGDIDQVGAVMSVVLARSSIMWGMPARPPALSATALLARLLVPSPTPDRLGFAGCRGCADRRSVPSVRLTLRTRPLKRQVWGVVLTLTWTSLPPDCVRCTRLSAPAKRRDGVNRVLVHVACHFSLSLLARHVALTGTANKDSRGCRALRPR